MLSTLIGLILAIQPAFADPPPVDTEVSLSQILDDRQNVGADIAYTSYVPMFEENQDPAKSIRVEVYFLEVDNTDQSKRKIAWLKSQYQHDLRANPKITTQFEAIGKESDSPEGKPETQELFSAFGATQDQIKISLIPSKFHLAFSDYEVGAHSSVVLKKPSREPASTLTGHFATLLRFSSSAGATYLGLTYGFHLAPETSLILSMFPGIGSGTFTHFSSQYGRYLVSENWSEAILEGRNPFARRIAKLLKIDPASMALRTPEERTAIRSRLVGAEGVTRYALTELFFTGGLIKLPQMLMNVTHESVLGAIGTSFSSAGQGYLAQGPGDTGIAIRKIQKFQELRTGLISGEIVMPNKDRIIEELNGILSKTNPANVTEKSDPIIQKIELWGKTRAMVLSFASVGSVVMTTVGVEHSTTLLVMIGVGGGYYFAKVNGWFKPEGKVTTAVAKTRERLQAWGRKLLSLPERICGNETEGEVLP